MEVLSGCETTVNILSVKLSIQLVLSYITSGKQKFVKEVIKYSAPYFFDLNWLVKVFKEISKTFVIWCMKRNIYIRSKCIIG